jgi:hypothetical protein
MKRVAALIPGDAVGGLMRGIVAIASVVFLLCAVGGAAHAVEPYILNLSGNNFSTNEAAQLGQQLRVVAMLSQVQDTPPFALPGITGWTTEYTINVDGLTLASAPGASVKSYTGGKLEHEVPVAVEAATWGSIKSLMRTE